MLGSLITDGWGPQLSEVQGQADHLVSVVFASQKVMMCQDQAEVHHPSPGVVQLPTDSLLLCVHHPPYLDSCSLEVFRAGRPCPT